VDPKQPPYEPIEFKMDVPDMRRNLQNIRWGVLVSGVMFGLTVCLVTTSLWYLGRMSAVASLYMAILLFGVRRRSSAFPALIGFPLMMAGFAVSRGLPVERGWDWWTPIPTILGAFFFPLLLIWIGRRWVIQYCRLEEAAAPKE
jgi:hypothetical protein